MNRLTTITHELPSGNTVKITIDNDDESVVVEGVKKANVIYGFDFDRRGYLPLGLTPENGDYIAVHTENTRDGVKAEFSVTIGGGQCWWTPLDRPALGLFPFARDSQRPYFLVGLKREDEPNFETKGRMLPVPASAEVTSVG